MNKDNKKEPKEVKINKKPFKILSTTPTNKPIVSEGSETIGENGTVTVTEPTKPKTGLS